MLASSDSSRRATYAHTKNKSSIHSPTNTKRTLVDKQKQRILADPLQIIGNPIEPIVKQYI
jgi:hypothetical protein